MTDMDRGFWIVAGIHAAFIGLAPMMLRPENKIAIILAVLETVRPFSAYTLVWNWLK